MVHRARKGAAPAPAFEGGVVDLKLALPAETADHVNLATHFGDRHFGAFGGHRGTLAPAAAPLCQDRTGDKRGADKERCHQHRRRANFPWNRDHDGLRGLIQAKSLEPGLVPRSTWKTALRKLISRAMLQAFASVRAANDAQPT